MNLRVTLVVLLSLGCGPATLTASTSYTFGTAQPFDLYNGAAGVWNDTVAAGAAGAGESIVCINAIGNIANVCGNPGPDDSVSISIPAAPGNQGIVPANPSPGGTTNYLIADGDPTYGAPVWTDMTGLVVGDTYILSFDQASSEEDGNAKEYHDNWLVYAIPYTPPGSGVGPYICLNTVCATASNPDPGDLIYQSPVMDNVPIRTTPADPSSTPWEAESINFTATSSNEILEFVTQAIAVGGGAFEPPLLALAGVTTTQTTPEPGTWVLTILGAGLVFAGSKLRRRTSTAFNRVKHAPVSTRK